MGYAMAIVMALRWCMRRRNGDALILLPLPMAAGLFGMAVLMCIWPR